MNRYNYILLTCVLCLALIWAVMPQMTSLAPSDAPPVQTRQPSREEASEVSAKTPPVTVKQHYMTAREHEGKLCLFSPDDDTTPVMSLDVNISSLPKSDRDMFTAGVKLYSESEVTRLIEDYTS